jgi:hypothetical protein
LANNQLAIKVMVGFQKMSNKWWFGFFLVFLSGFMTPPSLAAEYEDIFEKSYQPGDPKYDPRAYSLTKSSGGGYLLTGEILPGQSFVVKVRPDGQQEWQQIFKGTPVTSEQRDYAVFDTNDGGALAVGTTNSIDIVPIQQDTVERQRLLDGEALHDEFASGSGPQVGITTAAFAIRLDRTGQVVWKKAYGDLDDRRDISAFVCGTRTEGGFVLIGTKPRIWFNQPTSDGHAYIEELWIIKVNDRGDVVWETKIAEDRSELLVPLLKDPPYESCATPVVDAQGNIAFAVHARYGTSIVRHGHRIVVGPGIKYNDSHDSKLFVIKLDANGHELKRLRLESNRGAQLFASFTGYVLLDNVMVSQKVSVRETFLDRNLKIVSQNEIEGFEMRVAVMDRDGGIHLIGFRPGLLLAGLDAVLAYLRPNGELGGIKTLGRFPSWGEPVALVTGDSPGEVVLLQSGSDDHDIKLMKFRFSN